MKINDQQPIKPTDLAVTSGTAGASGAAARSRPETKPTPEEPKAPAPAATVELSARSRELHEALKAAHAAPDTREDKVAEAKERIRSGHHKVDAEQIARRILDRRA